MEKNSIFKGKILALFLVLTSVAIGVKAEQYTILFLNTPRIKIGEKWLKLLFWTKN